MARKHVKSQETPHWWLDQIERSKSVYREVQRLHYRRQLHGALDLTFPDITTPARDRDDARDQKDAPSETTQIDINYIQRYVRWVESQTFDQHPEIRYPRFATPDTQTGDMISELLKRVGDEAREMDEWRMTIADACAHGAFAVWYGIGQEVSDEQGLYYALMSEQEIIQMAEAGVHEAFPGQDHARLALVFKNLAMGDPADEESVEEAQAQALMPGGEMLQEQFMAASQAHEKAFRKEQKSPHPIRFAENEVWVQRRPIGESTLWDAEVDNLRDARWVARRFVMDIDEVHSNPAFNRKTRGKVEAGEWRNREGFFRKTSHSKDIPSTKAAIWEIWDRKYRERHFVVDQKAFTTFLEASPKNPYVDDLGRPLIKDFFPCVIEAPNKAPSMEPYTPHGIPIAAPAWPLQKAAIQFFSHNMDAVKKMATRMWEYDQSIDADELEALQSGQMGRGIQRSGDQTAGKKTVEPIEFGNVDPSMFQQFMVCENKIAMMLAWPISQMTGQPVADTATAEQISVTAGHSQLGDFIRTMENAYARGQEIKRELMRQYYSDEKVAELIGPEFVMPNPQTQEPGKYPLWRVSSKKGDRLSAVFQPRVEGESLARKKQIGDVMMAALTVVDPFSQLPLIKPSEIVRLFNEWVRSQGLGKVEAIDWESPEMQPMLQAAMSAKAGEGAEKKNGATGSGGHKKTGDKERSKGATSEQQMNASAAKAGPSGGAGRGMSPS